MKIVLLTVLMNQLYHTVCIDSNVSPKPVQLQLMVNQKIFLKYRVSIYVATRYNLMILIYLTHLYSIIHHSHSYICLNLITYIDMQLHSCHSQIQGESEILWGEQIAINVSVYTVDHAVFILGLLGGISPHKISDPP